MFAVIHTGGKQYKVKEGQVLQIESLPEKQAGDQVSFNEVLSTGEGENLRIGTPFIDGALVEAEIVKNGRGKKIIVFKKKRRKGYSKKQGHRQDFTEIKITKIQS